MSSGLGINIQITTRHKWNSKDWLYLGILLFSAGMLRIALFGGIFGSDDVVYLSRSIQIAHGVWESADYNGALRYGYNFPAAFFIWVFGQNIFAANLWPFLCNLLEIAAIQYFATTYINRKAGILAGLVAAVVPIHITAATKIHVDSVFVCFLTLAYIFLFISEHKRHRYLYFLTGLLMGMVFWAKELGAVALIPFFFYPIVMRRFNARYMWIVAGGSVMLAGHFLLMQLLAGDPLHLVKIVMAATQKGYIEGGAGEDSITYYFRYLFFNIKHTWIVAHFALIAIGFYWFSWIKEGRRLYSIDYTIWWFAGSIFVLSFMPVSLTPLRFAMKQPNYLTIFIAPLCILTGLLLEKIRWNLLKTIMLSSLILGGIGLGVLEQASRQVFAANSKGAVKFALAHPDAIFLASTNNVHIAKAYAALYDDTSLRERFFYFDEVGDFERVAAKNEQEMKRYIIIDGETLDWGSHNTKIETLPDCWKAPEVILPTGFGVSHFLISSAKKIIMLVPGRIPIKICEKLAELIEPKGATIYRLDGGKVWYENILHSQLNLNMGDKE